MKNQFFGTVVSVWPIHSELNIPALSISITSSRAAMRSSYTRRAAATSHAAAPPPSYTLGRNVGGMRSEVRGMPGSRFEVHGSRGIKKTADCHSFASYPSPVQNKMSCLMHDSCSTQRHKDTKISGPYSLCIPQGGIVKNAEVSCVEKKDLSLCRDTYRLWTAASLLSRTPICFQFLQS